MDRCAVKQMKHHKMTRPVSTDSWSHRHVRDVSRLSAGRHQPRGSKADDTRAARPAHRSNTPELRGFRSSEKGRNYATPLWKREQT